MYNILIIYGENIMDTTNVNVDENILVEIKAQKLNAETIKAIEDAEKGIGLSKSYTDLDKMWKDLEK